MSVGGGVATGSLPVRIGYRRSQISYRSNFFHKSYIKILVLCSFATVGSLTFVKKMDRWGICDLQYPVPTATRAGISDERNV